MKYHDLFSVKNAVERMIQAHVEIYRRTGDEAALKEELERTAAAFWISGQITKEFRVELNSRTAEIHFQTPDKNYSHVSYMLPVLKKTDWKIYLREEEEEFEYNFPSAERGNAVEIQPDPQDVQWPFPTGGRKTEETEEKKPESDSEQPRDPVAAYDAIKKYFQ